MKLIEGPTQIAARLDILIRLLALSVAPDNQSLKQRAVRLQRAGLATREIAAICNTTPNTVSVALSTAKRVGKKRHKPTK
jgi:DNA-binding NarL/FixJ family response regulator